MLIVHVSEIIMAAWIVWRVTWAAVSMLRTRRSKATVGPE